MHFPILKFVIIVLAAAFCAALTMFRYVYNTHESLQAGGLGARLRAMVPAFLGLLVDLAAALYAGLTMFRVPVATHTSLSDEGPRALFAEFLGWWICFSCVLWSVTVDSKNLRWTLWGAAALAAIAGITLSVYLSDTPEIRVTRDK
ncbi:MAG: hypothetical protein ABSA42_02000 [Terracidiphilus sp.]|jgi:hypothetical protein